MTDLEVLNIIRRRLTGVESELLVDPPCSSVQWVYAMTEVSKELAAAFEAPATAPPVNRDVPHLQGTGAVGEVLTVTMGNWDGEPTDYAFAWKRDGQDVGSNSMNYRVDTADQGHSITCVVTAINSKGSVAAPPSNAVAVAAAAGAGATRTPATPTPPAHPAREERARS
jgi:hypothetical protein